MDINQELFQSREALTFDDVLLLPAKRGAQSWIELPGTDYNLQPSEVMKHPPALGCHGYCQ